MSPTFYEVFMRYPVKERQRIADAAGLSLGYILKHTYVSGRQPKFHFANAVAMDKASGGVLSFLEHSEGEVDWEYVLQRLKQAKRQGEL